MIYESSVSYIIIDDKGNDKIKKEQFIIENLETFSDVEELLYNEFGANTDFDVVAIKRSKIKEIANKRHDENEKLFLAEVEDIFVNESGEEKPIRYRIVLFAKTFDDAKSFVTEFLKQGFDMALVSLKLTKFTDVL